MNKYDYFSALTGEKKVEYLGNVYEIIGTTYNGVIMQSVNDDTSISIKFRELRLNAEIAVFDCSVK
jgi:hypothetical protein